MTRKDNRLHMGSARGIRNDRTITTVLWALRTEETDVTSSLQPYAALTRLELEEKAYAERSRGQSSCWTKDPEIESCRGRTVWLRFPNVRNTARSVCRLRLSPGGHWLESY